MLSEEGWTTRAGRGDPSEAHLRVLYRGNYFLIPHQFLDEHPGGSKWILPYINGDMTESFDASGHSEAAAELLEGWLEGAPEAYLRRVREHRADRGRTARSGMERGCDATLTEKFWRNGIAVLALLSAVSSWLVQC